METTLDLVCNSENTTAYVVNLKRVMKDHNFMLCYRGNFNQNMIKSILSMTEKKMNNAEEDVLIKKKVFNVLVECLQNISKRSAKIEGTPSLLMIGKVGETYEVYSGNQIPRSGKDELKLILDSIALHGKDELKRLSKLLMTNDVIENSNSIEIALLDIAKKTGNKIMYEFKDLNEETTFFSLKTVITKNNI